jgi:hypothetical protein
VSPGENDLAGTFSFVTATEAFRGFVKVRLTIKFIFDIAGEKIRRFHIHMFKVKLVIFVLLVSSLVHIASAQAKSDEHAAAIVAKAVQFVGGDRYLQVKSQYGRGKFSTIRDGSVASFQSFTDVIVFPDKERTEFKSGMSKTIQTNSGSTGWFFDLETGAIKDQSAAQVANFTRGLRTSLDNLLRGYWKGQGELSYVGRRPGTLGKRNDVIRLTYSDGFAIEFEFADDGTPVKAIYKQTKADGEETTEEDRYAQFLDIDGIKTPFIVDRYTNGAQSSRINYDTVEFNKSIPDSVFAKPSNPKDLKKDLKM